MVGAAQRDAYQLYGTILRATFWACCLLVASTSIYFDLCLSQAMLRALRLCFLAAAGTVATETWHHLPDRTTNDVVVFATRTTVQSGGTYTFTFEQPARTISVDVPERTMPMTDNRILIVPASSTTRSVAAWRDTVTTFVAEPTVVEFATKVEKIIAIAMPSWMLPSDM